MSSSDLARALAARRKLKTRVCVSCGTPIETIGRRLYCNETCRKREYRKRLRDVAQLSREEAP